MNFDKTKVTNSFNETGFPFQQWCFEIIKNTILQGEKFEVISEYPFTFPPSNGPILGVHGTIDILAVKKIKLYADYCLLFLVIECKRANKSIKNWFFTRSKENRLPVFMFSDVDNKLNEKMFVSRKVIFPNLGYKNIVDFDYCNQVIEINDLLTTVNRNQEEKVYKAIKQVNHGVSALERKIPKYIEGITNIIDLTRVIRFFYIPVVVTTANLFIADFDFKKIIDGDISDKEIEYTKKKWLTFEFPLPDFISCGSEQDQRIAIEKRTTFIVNDKSFEEFLKNIETIEIKE